MSAARIGWCAVIALTCVASVANQTLAQDLPPELTGDYSDLPEPPADEPPIDPELGDVGPVDTEAAGEPETTETDTTEAPPEPELEAEPTESDVGVQRPRFYVGLGLGVGTLSFTRPADGGAQHLATTPFAAANVDLRAHFGHASNLSLEALLSYQTSLGLALESDPLFALPEDISVRVQRFDLSLAPRFKLSDSLALAVPIGFAAHLFTPETHQYPVHPYFLGGLMLRPELVIALTDRVSLRVGPEAQWLFLFNPELKREGVCCSGGALGGQATLQTSLGRVFSLALVYRELRTLIPVAARFSDVERVVTARLVGEL